MRHFFFDRYQASKKHLAKLAAAAGVAAALVAGTAQATDITIGNPGFETHPSPHPNFGGISGAAPWAGTGAWAGNGYSYAAHTGLGLAWVNPGDVITQTLGTNWAPGIYTLSGWTSEGFNTGATGFSVTSALLNGDTLAQVGGTAVSVDATDGSWNPMTTLTVVVNGGDPEIGHPIEISFTGTGDPTNSNGHRNIDDITLTLVPEPGSLILLGVGAAGLGLMARAPIPQIEKTELIRATAAFRGILF